MDINWAGSSEDWQANGWAASPFLLLLVLLLLAIHALRFLSFSPFTRASSSSSSSTTPTIVSTKSGNGVMMAVESAPIVTEADLKQLLEVLLEKGSVLSDDGKHVPWTPVVDKHNDRLSYNAKQREPEDGRPIQYLSTSVFRNCSPKQLRDFYMDNDYRMQWDNTFREFEQLDVSELNGQEIGRFIKRFPFIRSREYVMAWRLWDGDDGSYYYFAKHCDHPRAQRGASHTRVENYFSGWHIYKVPGTDDCEIKMWHQEDTTSVAKMAFSCRIWNYMCLMEKSLRNYKKTQYNGERNAVTLSQPLPHGLLNLTGFPSSVTSKPSLRSQDNEKRSISMRQTGKWMANGMLVLGAAAFCTRGSAPIGAKIAAIYAIKKLVQPSRSVRHQPPQQQ